MTTTPYMPRLGSLPARCINFFRTNPDEELSLDDISDKFGASRANIHTLLSLARDAGLLDRYRNPDGEYIYTAGKKIGASDGVDIDAVHDAKASVRQRAAASELPDPDKVEIDEHIPLPGSIKRDWIPLLRRLGVGHSAALPYAARYTLSRDITLAKKEGLGQYTLRADAAKESVRVWRIS